MKLKRKILIACHDKQLLDTLFNFLSQLDIYVKCIRESADFLLEVLEKDYDVIIYDSDFSNIDCLKMVKLLRRIRPKFPLVVIVKELSLELGGKILEENVAYFTGKPVQLEVINEVILSSLNNTQSELNN